MSHGEKQGQKWSHDQHQEFALGETFASDVGHLGQHVNGGDVKERSGAEQHRNARRLERPHLEKSSAKH